ncbi:MAG TPA: hypothetical protein VF221_22550 [Chloroflexota bacterium]
MFDRSIFTRQAQFSKAELAGLHALRTHYATTRQEFTDRELAHLRFMHWLVRRPAWDLALDQPVSAVVLT